MVWNNLVKTRELSLIENLWYGLEITVQEAGTVPPRGMLKDPS